MFNWNGTRIVCTVLPLAAAWLALAGCASGPDGQAADPSVAGEHRITVSMYDRGNIPEEMGTPTQNMWVDWVRDNSGIDVEYVAIPRGESVPKFNILLASNEAPDLITEYDSEFIHKLYNQKQIMPIDELIETYSTEYKHVLEKFPILKKLSTQPDGHMYAVGRVQGYFPFTYLFIREDWLDKLELDTPRTTEELLRTAIAFAKQDPDGNGLDDTQGINMSGFAPDVINSMFQNMSWVLEDGEIVRDWERAQAALEFKKALFDADAIDRDYLTDKNGRKAEQDFLKGKIGLYAFAGNAKEIYDAYARLRSNVPEAVIAPIALPASPFGQFSAQFNPPFQLSGVINAKANDPVSVIRYIDFMSKETTEATFKHGLEGVHYRLDNGVPVTIDKDKYDKEVSWLGDFRTIGPQYHTTEFEKYKQDLDLNKPFDREVDDLLNEALGLYISPERPYAGFTLDRYMPALPNEIEFIDSYAERAILDIWNRAILGGEAYSAEQAVQDARKAWGDGDGAQVEQWYRDWYKENKDKWVFTEDLYDVRIRSEFGK
ncbi:extracellular solute-binding protein [Paenibacillus sp. PAMC21692]|uniref:extracellular solute-binding protein n=1 Tax=Paenibacillus sp. PAMC21692 TaxID=2762320 RepID=UPI00164ED1B0|nr:extracellular solute-binding protein [Paenibacillus sp. PAMC21692]QNK59432.1 extracellular solute-binding protein [Paenibacillus sp. PAMC21692]